jgi:hypothetical protein
MPRRLRAAGPLLRVISGTSTSAQTKHLKIFRWCPLTTTGVSMCVAVEPSTHIAPRIRIPRQAPPSLPRRLPASSLHRNHRSKDKRRLLVLPPRSTCHQAGKQSRILQLAKHTTRMTSRNRHSGKSPARKGEVERCNYDAMRGVEASRCDRVFYATFYLPRIKVLDSVGSD